MTDSGLRSRWRQWLVPPRFSDREEARVASTVHGVCLVFAGAAALSFLLGVVLVPRRGFTGGMLLTGAALLATVYAFHQLHSGRVRVAGRSLIATAWGVTTASVLLAGSLSAPGFSAYILAIVAAGLMLGRRAAAATAIASALVGAGIGVLEIRGWLGVDLMQYDDPMSVWAVEVTLLFATAGLIFASLKHIRGALDDAARSEANLAERSREAEASREQYRALAEHSSDLIAEFDEMGACLYINRRAGDLLGRPPDSMLGRPFAEFVHEDDREFIANQLQGIVDDPSQSVPRHNVRMLCADGSSRTFEVSLSGFSDAAGARRIVATSRDITERLKSQETEALLRAAIEQAGDGIVIVEGGAGRVIFVNAAFEELSGIRREHLGGSDGGELLGPIDEVTSREIFETLAAGRIWRGRIDPVLKDGSRPVRAVTFAPVTTVPSQPDAIIGVVRDVMREVQLEADLRQAQKMEAVGQLAGGVAHDFNNLLLVITGYVQLLAKRSEADSESLELLDQVREAADRAAELTEQLLAFGRRQVARPRVVDLNQVVVQYAGMLRRLVRENVDIDLQLGEGLGRVKVDPGQIHQILLNLAANARDAMPEGGQLVVRTENVVRSDAEGRAAEVAEGSGMVMLSMTDSGFGIDSETRERIFEPFFTTKDVGKGTGLGLASVYGIVEQCGGSIEVLSEPGQGASFRICFPRTEEGMASVAHASIPPSTDLSGATVLVVEDQDGVRRLIRRVLEAEEYRVLDARDGVEALRLLEETAEPVDVLLTDVMMPNMDGLALASELLRRWPDLAVLYSSGYPQDEIAALIEGQPRADYLPKPFDPDDLVAKLRQLLALGA